MDQNVKNKLLQISYDDKRKQVETGMDTPDKRRAGIRRLLQKMQEGPVPDINTEKGLVGDEVEENAILRQVEQLEEDEESSLPVRRLPKSPRA